MMTIKEKPYQFRERLGIVHPLKFKDIPNTFPERTFALCDGAVITLGENAGEVIITAARDFCEYLFDTMSISARIARVGEATVKITVNPAYGKYKSFKVTVSQNGIDILAHDERGAAQALFF